MKKMYLKERFITIVNPKYWFSVEKSSKEVSLIVLDLIENNKKIEEIGYYSCKINGVTLWIANYPYGFGGLYEGSERRLPYRYIRILLAQKIKKQYPGFSFII